MKRKKPLRSDPEKTREWQRRSRRNSNLRRRSHLNRGKALRKSNPARRRREFKRAYGSEERVKWMKRKGCIICGATPSENAHIEGGGTGRKADADKVVPLCHSHHQTAPDSYHELGSKDAFEKAHGLSLDHYAAYYAGLWEFETEG